MVFLQNIIVGQYAFFSLSQNTLKFFGSIIHIESDTFLSDNFGNTILFVSFYSQMIVISSI